jgi:hypothetical protein
VEAELTALAASGATTLVGLMVSETWTQARDRVARFFARGGDEGSAEEELRLSREELVAARESGDEDAEADIEAEWRMRMRRALRADRQAAEELRQLLAELDPGTSGERPPAVHNSISGGVQNGPVFQGRDFSGLSFGSSGVRPPEREAGRSGE